MITMKNTKLIGLFSIMAITVLTIVLALAPNIIYQEAKAQTSATGGTANVVVVVHVINDNGGTKQASDITIQAQVSGSPPQHRTGTCEGTFTTVGEFPGSESGTATTINAPTCFKMQPLVQTYEGYSITASPCETGVLIHPHNTVTCSFTFNDIPTP